MSGAAQRVNVSPQQQQQQQQQQPQQQDEEYPSRGVDAGQMAGGWPGARGVVLRQVVHGPRAVRDRLPIDTRNVFKVATLPEGARVARSPGDPDRWRPTARELDALQASHHGIEYDDDAARFVLGCLCCCLCRACRRRPLEVRVGGADPRSALVLDRPCRVCPCLCSPCESRMDAYAGGHYLGQVREDCSPCPRRLAEAVCCCQRRHAIRVPAGGGAATAEELGAPPRQAMSPEKPPRRGDVKLETAYTLRAGTGCLGAHNNCGGASCLRNDAVFDLLDREGRVAGRVQRTYARGGSGCDGAAARWCCSYSTYLVEFPDAAPPGHRALILASVLQANYLQFEWKAGNAGDSKCHLLC